MRRKSRAVTQETVVTTFDSAPIWTAVKIDIELSTDESRGGFGLAISGHARTEHVRPPPADKAAAALTVIAEMSTSMPSNQSVKPYR